LCTGRGFGERRFGLRQLGAQSVGLQVGQHVTALHPVAHIDAHFGDLQAIGFCADDRLLPGSQIAVGADFWSRLAVWGVVTVTVRLGLAGAGGLLLSAA
jgi:hypothetical protein